MKNYILIGIIIVSVIIAGYFVYQNVQRQQIVDIQQTGLIQKTEIKIADTLLTKEKEICSPSSADGTPYCNSAEIVNNFSLVWHVQKCPNSDEIPEKIVIYDTLDNAIPPSGKSRIAYYCASLNQFWVSDYNSKKVPMGYWYGPFDGYPIK